MTMLADPGRPPAATSDCPSKTNPWRDAPAALIGQAAAWFDVAREDGAVIVRPNRPLPRGCTIRPAALFRHDRGFPDVNTVMGRLTFARGDEAARRYTPFTLDPVRTPRAVFLPVEAAPEDEWVPSVGRWTSRQAIAKRLLGEAGVSWDGLPGDAIDHLVRYVPWPEPLEGCVLHALTQWTQTRGRCVVEIGSFRGRSTAMLALALRAMGRDAWLISIDPHTGRSVNGDHVRLAVTQAGFDGRFVQMPLRSDEAWRLLRPGSASLVFVDGDHTYEQVARDFSQYRDVLAPGGCMVFHDYGYGPHNGRREADPDVRRAVDDVVLDDGGFKPLLLAHTTFAFVKEPCGGDVAARA